MRPSMAASFTVIVVITLPYVSGRPLHALALLCCELCMGQAEWRIRALRQVLAIGLG